MRPFASGRKAHIAVVVKGIHPVFIGLVLPGQGKAANDDRMNTGYEMRLVEDRVAGKYLGLDVVRQLRVDHIQTR